jgi:hypothetical protein
VQRVQDLTTNNAKNATIVTARSILTGVFSKFNSDLIEKSSFIGIFNGPIFIFMLLMLDKIVLD